MSLTLPGDPFDGQTFIDAGGCKWQFSATTDAWLMVGRGATVELASETVTGLMAKMDKAALDVYATAQLGGGGCRTDGLIGCFVGAPPTGGVTVGDDWTATFIVGNGNWSDAYSSHATTPDDKGEVQ